MSDDGACSSDQILYTISEDDAWCLITPDVDREVGGQGGMQGTPVLMSSTDHGGIRISKNKAPNVQDEEA